jgi:hypothetical protein
MLELLENHPKTATVVKQWLLDKMLESLKDESLPEDFKQHVREQGMENDKVAKILTGSPRALFDVFDNHKVYIDISCLNDKFLWGINNDMNNSVYEIRKEADFAAIVEAFKLLEAKL